MDVGSGYPKGLGSGAAILLGQVVVTNAYINGISGTYNTEKKNNKQLEKKRLHMLLTLLPAFPDS